MDFIGSRFVLHDLVGQKRHRSTAGVCNTFCDSLNMGILEDIFSTGKTHIYLHTSKPEYHPGDVVQGTVHLNVITPTEINEIKFRAEGCEKVHFTIGDSKHSARGVFFTRRGTLFEATSTLQPGVYAFPFQFTLSENYLPGSLSKNYWRRSFDVSIRYRLFVEVTMPGTFKLGLDHTQDLRVVAPSKQVPTAVQAYKEENVTLLRCIPKGSVSISANFNKNMYHPGDIVEAKVQVNNSASPVNLQACSLELIQVMGLYAKECIEHRIKVIKEQSPPIAAGEVCDRTFQMALPLDIEASTDAMVVECAYELAIRLSVPWSADVVLTQPIQIVTTPMKGHVSVAPNISTQVMMPEVSLPSMDPQPL